MVIYHSPSASHEDFMRFLEDIVEDLIIMKECMIIGDFNIDLMMDSFYAKKLQTTISNLGVMTIYWRTDKNRQFERQSDNYRLLIRLLIFTNNIIK